MLASRFINKQAVSCKFPLLSRAKFFSSDSHDDFKKTIKRVVPTGQNEVHELIASQVKENPVMLYMKGTPSAPQCGFSSQTVRILNAIGVDFSSVNVLG